MVDSTDVSGRTPLHNAAQRGQSEVGDCYWPQNAKASKHGTTPLMMAVKDGHLEVVKLLLDANAEINIKDIDGTTAIAWATKSGFLEIKGLLEQEASRHSKAQQHS